MLCFVRVHMFIAAKYVAYSVPKRHAANHFKVRIVCFEAPLVF